MATPIFLADTFINTTGSDYTTLGSHTSDNGATWTITTGGANAFAISPGGWLRSNINGQSVATSSTSMTGTSVVVTYDVQDLSNDDFFDIFVGQFILRNNSNNGCYLLNSQTGGSTIVNTSNILSSTPVHVEFHCSQTSQTLYVNGVSGWTDPAITSLTVSGSIGIQTNTSTSQSDTVGMQISNLFAYSVSNLTNTIAPDNSNVVLSPGNQWVNPSTSLQWIFPGTYSKFNFSGTSCTVNLNTATMVTAGRALTAFPFLNWSIDGGAWQRRQVQIGQTLFCLGAGLSSGTHTVEIRYEPQSQTDIWTPVDAILITGWTLDTGSSVAAPTGNAAKRTNSAIVLGDSITWGYYSHWFPGDPVPPTSTAKMVHCQFATLLGAYLKAEVGIVGYPGQGIYTINSYAHTLLTTYNSYDSTHTRSTWPANLTYVFIVESTNDKGNTSAANLEANLISIMHGIRQQTSTAQIVLVPCSSTTATTSDSVNILTAFNAAVASYKTTYSDSNVAVATAYFDANDTIAGLETPIFSQYTYDSVHPNGEGHAAMAGSIATQVIASQNTGGTAIVATGIGF